jgi:hypothetical protein
VCATAGSAIDKPVLKWHQIGMENPRDARQKAVLKLSQPDARKIIALLDNPPKPNQRLKAAVKIHKQTVRP